MTDRVALLVALDTRQCMPGTLYRFSADVPPEHTDIAVDPVLAMSGRLRRDIDVRCLTLSVYRTGERKGHFRASVWLVAIRPMRMYAAIQVLIPSTQPHA